jgi:hypothetical protein
MICGRNISEFIASVASATMLRADSSSGGRGIRKKQNDIELSLEFTLQALMTVTLGDCHLRRSLAMTGEEGP